MDLRRSATEAQLGLEFGGASKMEFESEFEFLFEPGLELKCVCSAFRPGRTHP